MGPFQRPVKFYFDSVEINAMRFAITTLFLLMSFSFAHGVNILNVKNRKVLVDLQEEDIKVGDKFIARDDSGKAKALIEITQVKNKKAIAVVIKGQVEKTFLLTKKNAATSNPEQIADSNSLLKENASWGAMLGLSSDSMTVKPIATSSANMSGSSFSLNGFYQREIDGNVSARFAGGYHAFTASGSSSSVSCSGTCSVDISYLGVEALVHYSFLKKTNFDFWGGGGLGFLFAINKSSNVLKTDKITTSQTILVSLGSDWNLSPKTYIPIQFDYVLFPDNSTSSANQMVLKIGYGKRF